MLTHLPESASKHPHSHDLPERNPHAGLTPQERLERLFLFLEAQFGADAVSPIAEPKLPASPPTPPRSSSSMDKKPAATKSEDEDTAMGSGKEEDEEREEDEEQRLKAAELDRLHRLGIPVPGVVIKVDKSVATVWLEDLQVESNSKLLADRVRAVVERAVEVTAPLWG